MALVFQYGSNCSESQFNSPERLRGDAKFLAIAETLMTTSSPSMCGARDADARPRTSSRVLETRFGA